MTAGRLLAIEQRLPFTFTESARWADSVYKSQCPWNVPSLQFFSFIFLNTPICKGPRIPYGIIMNELVNGGSVIIKASHVKFSHKLLKLISFFWGSLQTILLCIVGEFAGACCCWRHVSCVVWQVKHDTRQFFVLVLLFAHIEIQRLLYAGLFLYTPPKKDLSNAIAIPWVTVPTSCVLWNPLDLHLSKANFTALLSTKQSRNKMVKDFSLR